MESCFLFLVQQDSPKSTAKVRSYVASQGFTFPVVLDPNGQLLQKFNGQALPYSIMLDGNRNGNSPQTEEICLNARRGPCTPALKSIKEGIPRPGSRSYSRIFLTSRNNFFAYGCSDFADANWCFPSPKPL